MRISKVAAVLVGAGAVFAALGLLVGPTATAITNPVAHDGNGTTCAQVGFPGSVQYNGSIVTSVDVTALFTATVVGNKYVSISNIASGVVFQAVVLKGGNGYNVYNPPVASMRSPLNNGGNVPDLSHWFACTTTAPVVTTTTAPVVTTTTAPVVTTTTAPVVTTTTAPVVTTTTVPVVTTTTVPVVTTTTAPVVTTTTVPVVTTTTVPVVTTTTEFASEAPTTTVGATSTTTDVASEAPPTSSLPSTGGADGRLLVLGAFLVAVGSVIQLVSRRSTV
ncbi:MAG: hypothetical protein KA029_15240 [Ilumatobacteraceae bacterium]|nr:hypothetical protein [Ilumatobacteraceae bacterium]